MTIVTMLDENGKAITRVIDFDLFLAERLIVTLKKLIAKKNKSRSEF